MHPDRGPNPQPRCVPWLGIQPATLWSRGWHPTHWATLARALQSLLQSPMHICAPPGSAKHVWIAWASLVSTICVCYLSHKYACPNYNRSHRLVKPSCWPPLAHLHGRCHLHWQCLWVWALPTAPDKVSPFNQSRKTSSPNGLPYPSRNPIYGAGVIGGRGGGGMGGQLRE